MKLHSLPLLAALAMGLPAPSDSSVSATGISTQFEAVLRPALTVEVSASAVGVLQSVKAERGDRVTAGQVLAVLESETERADLEIVRARALSSTAIEMAEIQLRRSRARFEQSERLAKDGIISDEDFDQVLAERDLAELALRRAREERRLAQLELVRAQARLDQRTVKSPFDGVVLERFLSAGELVDRSQNVAILRLAQLDSLVIDVRVPQSASGSLQRGARAIVDLGTPEGGSLEGRVTVVDPMVDAATGTRRVRVTLPNPEYAIPPGLHCRVYFETP